MSQTARNHSIFKNPLKLAPLPAGAAGMSVTSRSSHQSNGHNLFIRNRENLVDLIVRKLRSKHVDRNPYFFAGPTQSS